MWFPDWEGGLEDQGDPGDDGGVDPGGERDAAELNGEGGHGVRRQRGGHPVHLPHLHHHVRDELPVPTQGGDGPLHPDQGSQCGRRGGLLHDHDGGCEWQC